MSVTSTAHERTEGRDGDIKSHPVHKTENGNVHSNGRIRRKWRTPCSSYAEKKLLFWDEVPPKLQFNRYITSGYRSNFTYAQCCCSLVSIHNETSNIWLHLGPGLYVLFLLVHWALVQDHPHKVAFFTVLVPELVCLLLSSAYHLFMAQVKHYDTWLKIDICGVFGVMIVPYWASVWWGYHCQPVWAVTVLALYFGCAITGLLASAVAKSPFARAVPMGLLVCIRIASLAHRWYLGTCSRRSLARFALMEVVCTSGALINVYRVPERWIHQLQPVSKPLRTPQPLDLMGNSHNIMHVLAVIAMWCIYTGVAEESQFLLKGVTCPI